MAVEPGAVSQASPQRPGAEAPSGPRHDLDDVLIGHGPSDGLLCKTPEVHIGFDGIDALTHHQPLIDGWPQSLHPAFEVPLEGAPPRPLLQSILVEHADASEVLREVP